MAAAVQHYHDSIASVLEKYAPVKLHNIRSNTAKPWYSDVIHRARQLRRQCERKSLKTCLEIHRELYVRQQEQVVRLINSAMRDYFRTIIASGTQSDAYRVINNLRTSTTTRSLPSHDSEQELADRFVQFFHCKVTAIRTALHDMQQQLPPLLEEPLPAKMPILDGFSTVTSADLCKLVQGSACASVSCMLDPAPTRLLKESAVLDCVLPHMLHVVNESLGSSVVHACLKMAVITPILKKPSLCVNSLKNFRPISNLPFLGKVIKKVVAAQLSSHLSAHSIHGLMQSAYRPGHSMETALLRIQDDINRGLDAGVGSLLFLLNLSAAFDIIDHTTLLERLEAVAGIRGAALAWLRSYLHDRTQNVIINGVRSTTVDLSIGVPQGSVLGPLLFLVYVIPLRSAIRHHPGVLHHGYADDHQLYTQFNQRDVDS